MLLKPHILLIALSAVASTAVHGQPAGAGSDARREIVLGLRPDSLISIGVNRIQAKSRPAPVDIYHSADYQPGGTDPNRVVIILETYKHLPDTLRESLRDGPDREDAYIVTTTRRSPLTLLGSGYNARATMYAAYRIAEMLETGAPLDAVHTVYRPKVKDRFVYLKYDVSEGVAITGQQSGKRRQNLTSRSLAELPLHGVNGIMMTDHPVFPWFPFEMSDGLTYKIEPQATDLKAIFREISQYGMEVNLHYPYFVFPDYTHDEIEEYLKGKKDIPGFIAHFTAGHERRLEALLRFFPEIDGLNLGGPEGTIGSISNFPSNGILREHQSDERSLLVLENYLKVVTRVAGKYNKKLFFWTHNWGQTDLQIRLLREMLYKFPTVGVLEDAHWNNSNWVNLPTLGYLSDDLKKDIGRYNKYYMMTFTDGEGLGGGVLPNSIPAPLYKTGQQIADWNFEGIVSRIDVQDKTSLGSLFNLNEINFIATMAPLWTPTEPLEQLWTRWVERRFGREAAPELLPVLKSSEEIILKGYMISGIPLMYHSKFETKNWLTRSPTRFRRVDLLLAKPGTPMVSKAENDRITSGEYLPLQLGARAVAIQQVRKDQERAIELCLRGANVIRSLRDKLARPDYEYLLTTYHTAYHVFRGLRAATEGLYYANINRNNFDNVDNPAMELDKAIDNIRKTARDLESEIGTDFFDQDFYYFPAALIDYATGLGRK